MKKLILVLISLLPVLAFGQLKLSDDFATSTGTPYKVVDAADKQYFADGKGNSISIKTQDKKVTIQRYDVASMKEINRHEYEDLPADSKVEKIIMSGGHLYYFYSTPTKNKTVTLNVREISLADGTFQPTKVVLESKGDLAQITTAENPFGVKGYGGFWGPVKLFEVIESTDKSKLLIRYRRKPLQRSDDVNYDILGFYSFDTNLVKAWGDEFKMPYTEKVMNNLSYAISKDGILYMLAYINDTKEFELLIINGAPKIQTIRLDIDNALYFQSIVMTEDLEGNLVCTGYYANGIEFKVSWTGNMAMVVNINGILRFKLNKKGLLLEKNKYDFPIALINEFESASAKEKNTNREADGKAGIADLKIVTITTDADGSTFILGEQTYSRSQSSGTSNTIVFYYADMIATKIDKNGKLLWMVKLPKTQWGTRGRSGNGVKYIKGDGFHYFLFVDTKKNANITKDVAPVAYVDGRDGFLTAYKVSDIDGKFERLNVLNLENVNGIEAFQFATSRIFDLSSKVFMIEIYMKGKEDTMIKIQLKK
jgi:hypothetical protein